MDDLIESRHSKLGLLREAGVEAYPYSFDRTHTVSALLAQFDVLLAQETTVAIAGRLVARRIMGKACFGHVHDDTDRMQVYARRDALSVAGEKDVAGAYELFRNAVDLGDWIGVRGTAMVTRTGERTLLVREWTLLAKCIRPLPVAKEEGETGQRHDAFADADERYRNRALDLAVNPQEREVFRTRARIVAMLRERLDAAGFLEVETPVLQPLYGGGTAAPFETCHNQLKKTLYLRIADELYLKRLIVGGLNRVYEISKDFRNEGVDRTHNPEFTMLECYAAFEDYTFHMDLVEEMVVYIARQVSGSPAVPYGEGTIDFTPPWPRVRFFAALQRESGRDLLGSSLAEVRAVAAERAVELPADTDWARALDMVFSQIVEPTFQRPTFVTDYPIELCPLARQHRDDERLAERFEAFAGGMEIANAFSELNDPADQRMRLEDQARQRAGGDREAMPLDEDYIQALELGMPPTAGLGIGIDRLTMLMTNRTSIRDVIFFPLLRDRDR